MKIPKEVKNILNKLEKNNYQAYVVGGCVRDILREVEPQDWDVATNAEPEEIEKIFSKTFCNNNFGTVTVLTGSKKPHLKEIEITPFRIDEKYTDKRHPDKISWAKTIEEDLERRDFTVNALALGPKGQNIKISKYQNIELIDLFNGQEDLKNKIIRAVREPEERFSEDALRMLRAVRFSITLGPALWQIEEVTWQGIKKNAQLLSFISKERIRDELMKIIMSPQGARGIETLRKLGLLKHIVPELEEGFGVGQNKHHIYQIYQHVLLSLNYACRNNFSKYVRLTALFHDIGKPKVKEGKGPQATFYNHEVVGAKMTYQILRRLRFPQKDIKKITKLVRYHLFYYNVDEVSASSVRRLLRKVGREDIKELLQVRMSDRIGSAVPKAEPYKLRHLKYMFEKVSKDPISVQMLKIDGGEVMKILKINPGPTIGCVLDVLLSEVLADPKRNKKDHLKKMVKEFGKLKTEKLQELAKKARQEIDKIETKRDAMTKKKYWVT